MTNRTVPLDLLVRVRSKVTDTECKCLYMGDGDSVTCERCTLLAELTAQIEREGQCEPVAWQYFDAGQWWPTSSIDKYPPNIPTRALYATPQDSVPAWAWRQAMHIDISSDVRKDWIESRALALIQTTTKEPT